MSRLGRRRSRLKRQRQARRFKTGKERAPATDNSSNNSPPRSGDPQERGERSESSTHPLQPNHRHLRRTLSMLGALTVGLLTVVALAIEAWPHVRVLPPTQLADPLQPYASILRMPAIFQFTTWKFNASHINTKVGRGGQRKLHQAHRSGTAASLIARYRAAKVGHSSVMSSECHRTPFWKSRMLI
jgi:hypothetical protein